MNARALVATGLVCLLAGCSESSSTHTIAVTSPTPTPTTSTPTITAVNVSGSTELLSQAGATTQLTATVTLSTGATEDRTASATWSSENTGVASVSAQGLVTAVNDGATTIAATVGQLRGTRPVSVRLPKRAPDPVAGQRLPMPDIRAFVAEASAARPELIGQSCPGNIKYVTNPWLNYIVDKLREVDTRWGYNAKPTRSPGDNGGQPVVAAGDEVAYHYSAGPDEGLTEVYLVDVLEGHCGPTPRVTYRVFTGEEPGRWTAAGRF